MLRGDERSGEVGSCFIRRRRIPRCDFGEESKSLADFRPDNVLGVGLCSVSAFGESCRGGEETDGLEKCLEQLSDLTRYILSHQAV